MNEERGAPPHIEGVNPLINTIAIKGVFRLFEFFPRGKIVICPLGRVLTVAGG